MAKFGTGSFWRSVESRVLFVGLLFGSILMLAPLIWMLLSSFKPLAEIMQFPPTWIPQAPSLANYEEVLVRVHFFRYYLNSIIVALVIVGSVIFTSTLAGYSLAKYNLPGGSVVFVLVLSMLMVPFHIRMIPLYMIMRNLGLIDTLTAIILPSLVSPFGVFLLRQFILTIPDSLVEAAELDGCTEFGKYWRIILPMVKPAIAALTIFQFRWTWNDLLWPMIITNSRMNRTLPVGMAMFTQEHVSAYHLQMAAATLVVLPVIIVFFLMQKQFIEGIALSGMKG